MHKTCIRFIFITSIVILFGSVLIFYHKEYSYRTILPLLINHSHPSNYSTLYENIVLLSCSSDSYNSVYCYYLPYIALAWRRIGFEPIVFLVGSEKQFQKKPLINLLKNHLNIEYYYLNVDSSYSISTSQIIRLFGGFLSYKIHHSKDLFILISDVDLLPITRSRFEISTNFNNSILAVNAYCCPDGRFSYENYHNIHYYPISYIGMNKNLWKKIFLPLENCLISSNITLNMINCCLKQRMNTTIPKNVIKGTYYWDIDQKFLSLLIARAEQLYDIYVDKRKLGRRLNPNKNVLSSEFNSILYYDDIHLPNKDEDIIFTNHTLKILMKAFANLFHNETLQLLSQYHHQTVAQVIENKNKNKVHTIQE